MRYRVVLSPSARVHLQEIVAYLETEAPAAADDVLERLMAQIASLSEFPHRAAIAREEIFFHLGLRQLIVSPYRVIFRIDEPALEVHVLWVRHAARRSMGEPDIQ